MSESPPDRDWIDAARRAAEVRLQAATASSDRLALLRERVRLQGGRWEIGAGTAGMASLERPVLLRFGLVITPDRKAFAITETEAERGVDEALALALRLDASIRSPAAPASPDAHLLAYSGHASYKSTFQKAAARAVVTMPAGAAMIASMPTGGGKSLLFQLLARQARAKDPHATIVVIVPTIALALDHERTLRAYPGLDGSRAMPSATVPHERALVRDAFRRGEVPVLLMSPECALGYAHGDLLEAAKARDAADIFKPYRLAAFVVDEAHIIEQWGRKFRPQFQRLSGLVRELRVRCPDIKTLLLSATLPPAARNILAAEYLRDCEALELRASTPRYEFDLFTRRYEDTNERNEAVVGIVDVLPRPAIVYTTTIDAAEDLHRRLTTERGYLRVGLFTGDCTGAVRQSLVDQWSADEIDLMIATSAFGMGVDKKDVRAIVHACLPESPSRYYQEIGRAGRDEHQAFALCLWTERPAQDNDHDLARRMATGSWLKPETAIIRWNAMLKDVGPKDMTRMSDTYAWSVEIKLGSHHEGIEDGTKDYNQNWNQSLLALLQRAGALRVLAGPAEDEGGDPYWRIEIVDENLLVEATPDAPLWERYVAVRDEEKRNSSVELTTLFKLLKAAKNDCLLAGVFTTIDPEAGEVAPCGRCPSCRKQEILSPSRHPAHDVDRHWPSLPTAADRRDPPGLHVMTFVTMPRWTDWLDGMVAAGVGQFYVSPTDAPAIADALADHGALPGLVTDWPSETMETPLGFADMSTVFVPDEFAPAEEWLEGVQRFVASSPRRPHYVLVRQGTRFRDRPLTQIASRHPARPVEELMRSRSRESEFTA